MAGEIYFPGFSGAFDWGAILNQLIAVKSIPIQKLEEQKQIINQKLQLLGEFSQKIENLKNLIENFNLSDALNLKSAKVSNTDVISVSVTSEAPSINFGVNVIGTASTEIFVYNEGFDSLTETIGSDGTFTLRYYIDPTNYVDFTIDYSSGDTLQDIVDKINNAQDYVRASIYFDGSKYKLMLAETSAENSTVETANDLSIKVIHLIGTLPFQFGSNVLVQQAQNARLQIGNGNVIESAGNTFENVIQGVNITVKQTGSSNVNISEDYGNIRSFLNDFVKAYNDLVISVKNLTLGENAPFKGENTFMNLRYQLANALNPLIELGLIEYKEDGTIALSGNLEQVIQDNTDEFQLKMNEFLNTSKNFINVNYDSFKDFKDFLQNQIDRIDERVSVLTERLEREEFLLKKQFSQLESFINYANDIRARLQQFIVSLSEMTGGKK